jgi:hypothetical protein
MTHARRGAVAGWLLAALTLAATGAWADDRATVGVTFRLEQPRYRLEFTPAELVALESKAAQVIAMRLGGRIGFVRFAPGRTGDAVLAFRLDDNVRTARGLREVGFHLELSGGGIAPRRTYWKFRAQDRFAEPVGSVEALVREIDLRVQETDHKVLVTELLSEVPIARSGKVWRNPLGWVIPHRNADLCMDLKSLLRVENTLPSGAGPVLKEYTAKAVGDFNPPGPTPLDEFRGRLFIEAMPGQEALDQLNTVQPDQVSVKAVYVKEYLHLDPCTLGPISFEAVDFRTPESQP